MGRFIMIVLAVGVILLVWLLVSRRNAASRQRHDAGTVWSTRAGSGGRDGESWPDEAELPEALGVPLGHPARAAAERLEAALGADYAGRIKQRVLDKHPRMSGAEWSWTWLELKRYFLMSALCPKVPMYSGRADAIWHEMLMFTREYEQFCHRFCGDMIHHAPHGEGSRPVEGERAWFDWLYGELFSFNPASVKVWGTFYRTPMSRRRLQQLEEANRAELLADWFNPARLERYSELRETADYVLGRLQSQMLASRSGDAERVRATGGQGGFPAALPAAGILSGLLIYHSLYHDEQFGQKMSESFSEAERQARDSDDAALLASLSSLHTPEGSSHQARNSGCTADAPALGSSSRGHDDSNRHNSHDRHGNDDSGSGGGSDGSGSSCSSSSCSSCSSCSS